MGRHPRSLEAGIFHVAAHASDTRRLFVDDVDKANFLASLGDACELFELGLVSYVLMDNHYHALFKTADGLLSNALRHLHTKYARDHNRRHGRKAHLFRAHPFVGEIRSSEQLVTASRYLARNPVEVGLCADPFSWPWSSASGHAGLERPRLSLCETDLEGAYGEDRDWRVRYREYVSV